MGISSSTPESNLSQEQQDVKYLGERMPFGDEELIQVYRAYQAVKSKPPEERISFLTDIGVECVTVTNKEKREERMVLLQAVEHKLLPPNLGNRLYETAFLPSSAASEYQDDGTTTTAGTTTSEDNFTRRSKLEAFFDGLSNCSRRGNQKALKVLIDCCKFQKPEPEETNKEGSSAVAVSSSVDFAYGSDVPSSPQDSGPLVDPVELATIGYRVGLASGFLSAAGKDDPDQDVSHFFPDDNQAINPESHSGLLALAQSLKDFAAKRKQRMHRLADLPNIRYVSEPEVQEWAEQVAPMFGSTLATFAHFLFFPNRPYPPSRTSFDFPSLAGFTSSFVSRGSSSVLFSFGCMSPSLGGEYYRLYTSASDGLSFNRLQNALLGYGGPTLIIIQSGKCLFGAFTASPWKESKDFYGNHDCFLYQLLPQTAVYRPSGNAKNFMYCNSFARSRGYDQQAHGIGFGGTTDQPRLFLAESFDNCRAAAQDMTFESGRLLEHKGSTFEIDNLEVWGVGGTDIVQEALGARSRQRDIKNAAIQKARKVDKAQFLDDFRSGLIESKAFQHREQIRGREGAVIDDEDLKHYKNAKT